MPRDTPPPTIKPRPRPVTQPVARDPTPPVPVRAKSVEKIPEPILPVKQGPSDTLEEAFLRAGATVIEAAPVLRDFQKEAVTFVPSAVKRRPQAKGRRKEEEARETVDIANVTDEVTQSVEKSLATTVEDVEEDTEEVAEVVAQVAIAPYAKRPLEEEKKPDIPRETPTAPPKRRRLVNAAPDV
jgi:hypothetical protein